MTVYHVITLDGPVGVGKSSIARILSRILGYRHIDTGAMYRAVTLAAMEQNIDLEDEQALTQLAQRCDIKLVYDSERLAVFLDGRDVTEAIRDPLVSRNTSPVADTQGVRQRLVALQRSLGLEGPSILEGRDISTVVFPDAFWKFYLDASLEERTRRRILQLKAVGKEADFQATLQSIRYRDLRDRSRSYGPLLVAQDAIVIDTTFLGEQEVVRLIETFVSLYPFPEDAPY